MTEAKAAIVTAGGRGIGAACARTLAERGYGLALMSPSGSAEALAQELGGIGMRGSVTDVGDIEALVARAIEEYGRVDAVVNHTGYAAGVRFDEELFVRGFGEDETLLGLSDDDWHGGLEMYMLNVVRMARAVTPIMQRQGGGALLNITTMATFEPRPVYPASVIRAALAGFTKLYADRYGADGIRMNNLAPGYMENVKMTEPIRGRIPAGRAGTMEEIGRTAAFLVSPDAAYITGRTIVADGGLNRSIP